MKKHEIQIKPYYHVLDIHYDNKPYDNKIVKWPMRIGDVCRTMICAKYKRVIENKFVYFEYMDDLHHNMKMHVLFDDCVDNFSQTAVDDDVWIYDVGHPDVMSTYVMDKYGDIVIPNVNLDKDEYSGPEFDWGNYFVFCPLFFTEKIYNITRYHDSGFVNRLIDRLFELCGDKLLIVTDQPELVDNDSVSKYTSDSLYDAFYVVGNSSLFIGGQSGFTHFASLCKVPRLIALYSHNAYGYRYYESHAVKNLVNFEKWARIYTEMGQLKDYQADIYPAYHRDYTSCNIFTLYNNKLYDDEIDEILRIVEYSMLVKKPSDNYYVKRPTQDLCRIVSIEDVLHWSFMDIGGYDFRWKVFSDKVYDFDSNTSIPIIDDWMAYCIFVNDEVIECASKDKGSVLFNIDYYS